MNSLAKNLLLGLCCLLVISINNSYAKDCGMQQGGISVDITKDCDSFTFPAFLGISGSKVSLVCLVASQGPISVTGSLQMTPPTHAKTVPFTFHLKKGGAVESPIYEITQEGMINFRMTNVKVTENGSLGCRLVKH